jgi:cytidylate kinase
LVITVDGPAAAGKSTVARALARRLGFQYLDTGAMYRAATQDIYRLADQPAVRQILIEQQRALARGRDVVAEGRDQGTEVFPDAAVKFYLDASLEVRARRRLKDMGGTATLEEVKEQVAERDARDRSRPMGALRQVEDMVCIDSTQMSVEAVVETMLEEIGRRRQSGQRAPQER